MAMRTGYHDVLIPQSGNHSHSRSQTWADQAPSAPRCWSQWHHCLPQGSDSAFKRQQCPCLASKRRQLFPWQGWHPVSRLGPQQTSSHGYVHPTSCSSYPETRSTDCRPRRPHSWPSRNSLKPHKTYEKLRRRYYWRDFSLDEDHWCRSCVNCAMRKRPSHKIHAPPLPIPVDGASDRVAIRDGLKHLLCPPSMLQPLLDCWWMSCVVTVPYVPCCRTVAATSFPSWSQGCAE